MVLGYKRSEGHFYRFIKRTDTTLLSILNNTLVSIDVSNEVPEFDPNDIELEVAEAKANNEIRKFGAIYYFGIGILLIIKLFTW